MEHVASTENRIHVLSYEDKVVILVLRSPYSIRRRRNSTPTWRYGVYVKCVYTGFPELLLHPFTKAAHDPSLLCFIPMPLDRRMRSGRHRNSHERPATMPKSMNFDIGILIRDPSRNLAKRRKPSGRALGRRSVRRKQKEHWEDNLFAEVCFRGCAGSPGR
ncbi:hypothetical protein OE88DRAFT_1652642 [Heliocybe sulcata]|uniref:Uncharacterized protein n=1 Tax=Heliocybe sulcata TaxID=5364 RepID=A0A5C3NGJ5_9AGAM|nr:hypothetical protein OE88DRAFT_1652642 [Heliocybe sulcata]